MHFLSDIPQNTLKISVKEIPDIYAPEIHKIIIRHELGMVIMFIDDRRIELNTLTAHKIGYTMATAKLAPNEMIVLSINGEKIDMVWPIAVKVSSALLRKADDADDFQLRRNT